MSQEEKLKKSNLTKFLNKTKLCIKGWIWWRWRISSRWGWRKWSSRSWLKLWRSTGIGWDSRGFCQTPRRISKLFGFCESSWRRKWPSLAPKGHFYMLSMPNQCKLIYINRTYKYEYDCTKKTYCIFSMNIISRKNKLLLLLHYFFPIPTGDKYWKCFLSYDHFSSRS